MRKLFSLTFIFLLSGCGADIDLKYGAHVNEFVIQGRAHGVDVSLNGLTVRDRKRDEHSCETTPFEYVVGCCQSGFFGPTIIITSEAYSDRRYTETDRQLIIFHEMGHCILGRKHTTGFLANGAPDSVMNMSRPSEREYDSNRDYYMSELFSK